MKIFIIPDMHKQRIPDDSMIRQDIQNDTGISEDG